MRFSLVIALFLLLNSSAASAQATEGMIIWSEDRPLKWSDFQGTPIKNSYYHAQTQGSLNYTFDNSGPGAYTFRLNVKFDKQKSWRKPEEETENLLAHEQGHFNIYEIYGRMIMKEIAKEKVLESPKFSEKIEKIFRNAFSEMQSFQKEYDKETNHSKEREKQVLWNKKFAEMLKELEPHKNKEIPFKVQR